MPPRGRGGDMTPPRANAWYVLLAIFSVIVDAKKKVSAERAHADKEEVSDVDDDGETRKNAARAAADDDDGDETRRNAAREAGDAPPLEDEGDKIRTFDGKPYVLMAVAVKSHAIPNDISFDQLFNENETFRELFKKEIAKDSFPRDLIFPHLDLDEAVHKYLKDVKVYDHKEGRTMQRGEKVSTMTSLDEDKLSKILNKETHCDYMMGCLPLNNSKNDQKLMLFEEDFTNTRVRHRNMYESVSEWVNGTVQARKNRVGGTGHRIYDIKWDDPAWKNSDLTVDEIERAAAAFAKYRKDCEKKTKAARPRDKKKEKVCGQKRARDDDDGGDGDGGDGDGDGSEGGDDDQSRAAAVDDQSRAAAADGEE